MTQKIWFDTKLSKFISRKLMVFIIACFFLMGDKISGDVWSAIAALYISVEGISKTALLWKSGTILKD